MSFKLQTALLYAKSPHSTSKHPYETRNSYAFRMGKLLCPGVPSTRYQQDDFASRDDAAARAVFVAVAEF